MYIYLLWSTYLVLIRITTFAPLCSCVGLRAPARPPTTCNSDDALHFQKKAKQTQIHTAMKPVASLLEFSLPWKKGSTSAPVGEIWLPIWGKSTGTVGRLVSTSTEVVQYDHTKFEEQMFFFNTMTRANAFKYGVFCHVLFSKRKKKKEEHVM